MDQNGTQVKADALYEKDGANAGCLAYMDNFLRNYIADEMDIHGLVFPRWAYAQALSIFQSITHTYTRML